MQRGGHHRCQTALHILRTAAIHPAALLRGIERCVHPRHTDRVHVSAEHKRPALTLAVQYSDHIRTPWHNLLNLHVHRTGAQFCRNGSGDFLFARGSWSERGIDGIDCNQIAQEVDGGIGHNRQFPKICHSFNTKIVGTNVFRTP